MTKLKLTVLALAACLAGAALASPAYAHGPRTRAHIGLHFGVPLAWPFWGYPNSYYYPPYQPNVVVVPQEPTVYVERQDAGAAGNWYYCAGAGAYYPYVRECPGGWQRVAPRPPGE